MGNVYGVWNRDCVQISGPMFGCCCMFTYHVTFYAYKLLFFLDFMSKYLVYTLESFGWILLNSKLIGVIGTVSTYLAIWGKRVNCGNTIAEIQQKLERER